MPHEPGHTTDTMETNDNGNTYTIAGTNQPYQGNVINIGGNLYTTSGNTLEYNSQRLNETVTVNPTNQLNTTINDNPVVETFVSSVSPRYRTLGGVQIPGQTDNLGFLNAGVPLHRHADGTVMIGHDPNEMGVTVVIAESENVRQGNTIRTPLSTRSSNSQRMPSQRAASTSRTSPRSTGGGMSGRGSGGGGGGGY